MLCKIVCMRIVACSTHELSDLKHVQSGKWNWGYLKMVSPVFINEAFDFRTFCVMEFLRLFHGPTPLLYVLYLFSSSFFFPGRPEMHKGIQVSQCQNARHFEAAEPTKDGCTNIHIHRAFLLSPSLQAIHLAVLLSLHGHINSVYMGCFVQVHTLSPLRGRRRLWAGAITII